MLISVFPTVFVIFLRRPMPPGIRRNTAGIDREDPYPTSATASQHNHHHRLNTQRFLWRASRTYILRVWFILSSLSPLFCRAWKRIAERTHVLSGVGNPGLVVSIYLRYRAETGIGNVRTVGNTTRYSSITLILPTHPFGRQEIKRNRHTR